MTDSTAGVRELNLYRQYFDLLTGTKTIEVRVKYPHLADLAAGDTIRFRIKGTDETCEVQVKRVTEYPDFETLLDGEGPTNVNPTSTRDQQLANIRAIYPQKRKLSAQLPSKSSAPPLRKRYRSNPAAATSGYSSTDRKPSYSMRPR